MRPEFRQGIINEPHMFSKKSQSNRVARVILGVLTVSFLGIAQLSGAEVAPSSIDSRRAELERDLATLESQIDAQKDVLEGKQRERVSLERDVAILEAKIEKARLSIQARNIRINQLHNDIAGKEETIDDLSDKLEREKQSLAQIIRRTNEIDSYSFAEIFLSGKGVSGFFEDLDAFDSVKISLQNSYQLVVLNRDTTEEEKVGLEEKAEEEVALRQIQELEKQRIEEQENDLQGLLKVTKGQEAEYQKIIAGIEKSAAQIRAELFTLRGSAAIPFEKAYEYAKLASSETGVRPALILGIIAEESNLGENVGTGSWRVDMKNPRDTVPFLDITKRLGLDPDKMPVSKKPWYGWGGAMGPAQFIPSTWILYEDKIAELTGHNPPNPWDPRDAFMASAILLKDNGAGKGTWEAERLAALRYFAGWANATKSAYAFYGDDVMELSAKYQGLIDILERS